MSPRNHSVPLAESQQHVIDPANPCRALDDGVEDRLHVGGRAADDAEHLGRCGLMLQRLAQFRIALPEFLEQSHILDGDDRLVGESLNQGNLIIGKWTNFVAAMCITPISFLPKQWGGPESSGRSYRYTSGDGGENPGLPEGRGRGSFLCPGLGRVGVSRLVRRLPLEIQRTPALRHAARRADSVSPSYRANMRIACLAQSAAFSSSIVSKTGCSRSANWQ